MDGTWVYVLGEQVVEELSADGIDPITAMKQATGNGLCPASCTDTRTGPHWHNYMDSLRTNGFRIVANVLPSAFDNGPSPTTDQVAARKPTLTEVLGEELASIVVNVDGSQVDSHIEEHPRADDSSDTNLAAELERLRAENTDAWATVEARDAENVKLRTIIAASGPEVVAVQQAVIRRLLDGWEPGRGSQTWQKPDSYGGGGIWAEPMTDAERAVIEAARDKEEG